MTHSVDLILDEETIRRGASYGLIEERDGHLHMSSTGLNILREFIERAWDELPTCPKCDEKAYLDHDYICRECRYGFNTALNAVVTGY